MIRKLVKWLFGVEFAAERAAVLREAKNVLDTVRSTQSTRYIRYERLPIDSESFLYSIQPVIGNRALISWLMDQREACVRLCIGAMAAEADSKVLHGMAQVSMIDSLLSDMLKFGEEYEMMIEGKKAAQDGAQ